MSVLGEIPVILIIISVLVSIALGIVTIYYRIKKPKPNLKLDVEQGFYRNGYDDSTITFWLAIHNTGQRNTTMNGALLKFKDVEKYKLRAIIPDEILADTTKQIYITFECPNTIYEIENAKLTLLHTHGEKSIKIKEIPEYD